jgi:hypothetical protein
VGVNVGVAVGDGVAVQAAAVIVATSSADGPQLAISRIAASKIAKNIRFMVYLLILYMKLRSPISFLDSSSTHASSFAQFPQARIQIKNSRTDRPSATGLMLTILSPGLRSIAHKLRQMSNSTASCINF